MPKKKSDYRLTRSGRSEWIEDQSPTKTENRKCPLCLILSTHHTYCHSIKNRKTTYKVCQNCLGKWGGDFATKEVNARGKKGQIVTNQIWGWITNNHERIFAENVEKLHIAKGHMGHKRRHKGKPVFSGELHPELLRILSEPETIRMLARALEKLRPEDEQLYSFIYLKSKGFTYQQIGNALGVSLVKTRKKLSHHIKAKRMRTGLADALSRKAARFILLSLPDSIKRSWKIKSLSTKNGDVESKVDCPACLKKDIENCSLCNGDGTVPSWLCDKYLKKTESGTWEFRR